MNMLKKMILAALLITVVVFCAQAQLPYYKAGEITVGAGVTNVSTDTINLFDDARSIGFRHLKEMTFENVSGTGTGTITVASVDMGVTDTVFNAGEHIPAATTIAYPYRTNAVQSIAGWVVTGDVAVAKSTIVSNYAEFNVRQLKIKIEQPASATATIYRYTIKAQ